MKKGFIAEFNEHVRKNAGVYYLGSILSLVVIIAIAHYLGLL